MPEMPGATALLALWNGVAPEHEAEYNRWHAEEHVPERLTVPGMLWARRYAAFWPQPGPRYLTLYGLRDARVLEDAAYQRLLRDPTPWSTRMRPHLRDLSRWVCALAAPCGGPQGAWLQAHIFDDAERALQQTAGPDEVLAERLPDAAPLPWLQSGQALAVQGGWLRASGHPAQPAAAGPHAMVYAALPVGMA